MSFEKAANLMYGIYQAFYMESMVFKPGACRPDAGAPGFLKLFLCRRLYVCVYLPSRLVITSGVMWCDIYIPHTIGKASSKAVIWQLQSLSLIGVALKLIRIVDTNPVRLS